MKKKKLDKKIFVFGGSGGIGLEICNKFLKEDFKVYFTSKSSEKIKKIINKNKKNFKSQKIVGLVCNIENELDIKKAVKIILKNDVKIIINAVGIFGYENLKNIKTSNIIKYFRINTLPSILINKYLLKFYKPNHERMIITIGSSSSYNGFTKTTSYSSSKHALMGAIRSMNHENLDKKIINICVNPGSVKTKMGKLVKNQRFSSFIEPDELSEFIYSLSSQGKSFFIEDIWLKRTSV